MQLKKRRFNILSRCILYALSGMPGMVCAPLILGLFLTDCPVSSQENLPAQPHTL